MPTRHFLLDGTVPELEVPSMFHRPYRGIPQFDLASLPAAPDGPSPWGPGQVLAPVASNDDPSNWVQGSCPYRCEATIPPVPWSRPLRAAPITEDLDERPPPLRSGVRPRADPSR